MTEVKLLTEAEALRIINGGPLTALEILRERGLIAPEPEKTPSDHAWQVCVDHGYRYPHSREHNLATAALRRGMELAPAASPLTREMVREAIHEGQRRHHGGTGTVSNGFLEGVYDALHAALTEGQSK